MASRSVKVRGGALSLQAPVSTRPSPGQYCMGSRHCQIIKDSIRCSVTERQNHEIKAKDLNWETFCSPV